MLVFLDINQLSLDYTDEELIHVILQVASGEMDYNGLLDWPKNPSLKLQNNASFCVTDT